MADYAGQRIRKVTPTGFTSLVAGTGTAGAANGALTSAAFSTPTGCVVDSTGNLFIADRVNQLIRKITFSTGLVSTFAGTVGVGGILDGFGTYAQFNGFYGICSDTSNNIYVPDTMSNIIRKITAVGQVTRIAGTGTQSYGDGAATSSMFYWPCGCAVDNVNNRLIIADTYNHRIRAMPLTGTMTLSTLAGTGGAAAVDGFATAASFYFPIGVAVTSQLALIIGDAYNYRVRRIANGVVTTIAGSGVQGAADGFSTVATFGQPRHLVVDANDNVFVSDFNSNKVRKIFMCSAGATFDQTQMSCVCGAGFQLNPNNTCSSCPDGYFQASSGNAACIQCPAGTQSASNRQSCSACSSGLYRSLGMASCQSCPLGTEVLLNQTGCAACTYGRVRTISMSVCTDCSLGFEAAANKSVCTACAAGTYRPSVDYLKCASCPPLATCSGSAITACQAGYKINSSANGCDQCPVGTQSGGDFLSCVGCTVGTNYRSSLSQSTCQACPSNSVCSTASSFTCNAAYEPTADGTGCSQCQEGYSKSGSGNSACSQCAIGTESAANKQSCTACPSGKYRPATLINKCIPCPQNGACTASVLTCNAGFKLNAAGDGCDQCPIGQQSNAGFTACVSCVSGTNYRSSLTQSTCLACPANAGCTTTGFTCNAGYEPSGDGLGCTQCQEGYSKSASGNVACSQCTAGSESAANKQSCSACLNGWYRPSTAFNKCIPCPPYGICSSSALTRCANGYIINSSGDGCDQCPLGQDSTDGLACQGCQAGYFKPQQSYLMCQQCPLGAPSCGGSLVSCQSGYFFDSSAQCKRNETYFAAMITGTAASGTTITQYVTLTQTSTSTSTTTSTSTSSIYFTATAIQTQPVTLSPGSVTVNDAPVTVAAQSVFVTVFDTAIVTQPPVTSTSTQLIFVTSTIDATPNNSNNTPSVTGEQSTSNSTFIDGLGSLPISHLIFGLLSFILGTMVSVISALVFGLGRKKKRMMMKDGEFEPVGLTSMTATMNNTTSQRTFTDKSLV